jgi:hypothetical protein
MVLAAFNFVDCVHRLLEEAVEAVVEEPIDPVGLLLALYLRGLEEDHQLGVGYVCARERFGALVPGGGCVDVIEALLPGGAD